eukprot:COSAG01_NODE_60883_length_292_cov_0.808290_1_plen_97_part_11
MTRGWARCLEEMFGKGAVTSTAADVFTLEGDMEKVKVAAQGSAQFCEEFLCLANLDENTQDADVLGVFKQRYEDAKADDADSDKAVQLRPAKHFVLR